MDLLQIGLNELGQGYQISPNLIACNYCQTEYPYEKQPNEAIARMKEHLVTVHKGSQQALVALDSKYNTLTTKQKELLLHFGSGEKDQEIAEKFEVSPSTIRHQKFTFREKAKQAKVYLAQFEAIFSEKSLPEDNLLPVPDAAGIVDDRFLLTETEYAEIVRKYFEFSTGALVLTVFPKGQKNIIGILNRIVEEFTMHTHYSGKEVDEQLKAIYFDYLLIKRYLIDYGFFTRTPDGADYYRLD
ncbi:hypothetical protein BAU15_14410 [Enterococcus sp. JM4C]|uniref:DUF2087 domain-containing protein n=1 Tax=Candidatus Enterococcus huntleyi TaxID=1857217 RepID=UPI00137B0E3D|nr:DUF2087 domain-containing protein [Enterococcus sp. JM4C]KAF1296893.1 hypothetical protein BAU15_14410 [Enterococcus sp. JM4C]